jgi:hypothetical protein
VKFRLGSPSFLGEKVASGLVWRFGTFDYVSDNLACFEDGLYHGDDYLARPRAEPSASWHPRDRRDTRPRRLASTKEPAAPTAG